MKYLTQVRTSDYLTCSLLSFPRIRQATFYSLTYIVQVPKSLNHDERVSRNPVRQVRTIDMSPPVLSAWLACKVVRSGLGCHQYPLFPSS